jgi:hypothetical protein
MTDDSETYMLLPRGYELIEDDHMVYLYKGAEVIASFTTHIDPQCLQSVIAAIVNPEGAI